MNTTSNTIETQRTCEPNIGRGNSSLFNYIKIPAMPLTMLSNAVKKRIHKNLRESDPFAVTSYSCDGEDIMLREIFGPKNDGFYIDIGANHPQRDSNTNSFYNRGWHGINVDPLPGSMELFNKDRPRDINLELAISDQPQTLTYYQFNASALNSFCIEAVHKHEHSDEYHLIKETPIQTHRLEDILDQHVPNGLTIDLLDVDVEGLDLAVLRSNNWSKYRPTIILAEDLDIPLQRVNESELVKYMQEQNYELLCKTLRTLFFRDNSKQ